MNTIKHCATILTLTSIFAAKIIHANETWEIIPKFTTGIFNKVIYSGDKFVAIAPAYSVVTKKSQTQIATSKDGTSWQYTTAAGYFNSIIYADSQFIAVGDSNIYTSKDALSWKMVYSGAQRGLKSVATLNGEYVVKGDSINGSGLVLKSSDGKKWSQYSSLSYMAALESNGSVILSLYGNRIYSTTNGYTWKAEKTEFDSIGAASITLRCLKWLNGEFIVSSNSGYFLKSKDGKSWSSTKGNSISASDIAWGLEKYVAIVDSVSGAITNIFESSNGSSWNKTSLSARIFESSFSIAFGNGKFVIVGTNGLVMASKSSASASIKRHENKFNVANIEYDLSGRIIHSNGARYTISSSGSKIRVTNIKK